MPKIQWERLPSKKWAHLRQRARERRISQEDLFKLAEWKAQDPDVPEGEWYKDFGTFKLCGARRYPSTFLLAGQAARGKPLSVRRKHGKAHFACYFVASVIALELPSGAV